jgi:hypothetical protein
MIPGVKLRAARHRSFSKRCPSGIFSPVTHEVGIRHNSYASPVSPKATFRYKPTSRTESFTHHSRTQVAVPTNANLAVSTLGSADNGAEA